MGVFHFLPSKLVQTEIDITHSNLKYRYWNRHFWCRGYYVDTVRENVKRIKEYIRKQLQKDKITDEISLKEYVPPFTGELVTRGKKKPL